MSANDIRDLEDSDSKDKIAGPLNPVIAPPLNPVIAPPLILGTSLAPKTQKVSQSYNSLESGNNLSGIERANVAITVTVDEGEIADVKAKPTLKRERMSISVKPAALPIAPPSNIYLTAYPKILFGIYYSRVLMIAELTATIVLLGVSTQTYPSLIAINSLTVCLTGALVAFFYTESKKPILKRALYVFNFSLLPLLIATACMAIKASSEYTDALIICHSECSSLTDIKLKASQSCFNSKCSTAGFEILTTNLKYYLYGIFASVFMLLTQTITFCMVCSYLIEFEDSSTTNKI